MKFDIIHELIMGTKKTFDGKEYSLDIRLSPGGKFQIIFGIGKEGQPIFSCANVFSEENFFLETYKPEKKKSEFISLFKSFLELIKERK